MLSSDKKRVVFSFFYFIIIIGDTMNKELVHKKRLKKSVIFKSFSLITLIVSIIFFVMFIKLNIFPESYLTIMGVVLLFINAFLYFFLSRKNYLMRMLGTVLAFGLTIMFGVGINYQHATLDFFHNLNFLNVEQKTYHVIALKDGNYRTLKDLNNKTIAYVMDNEAVAKMESSLKKEITYSKEIFESTSSLIDDLLEDNVDAIVLEDEEKSLYQEMEHDFKEETIVIDSFSIETPVKDIKKDVEITKEPFNIYITGVDTYGELSKVARSDVNILATINPLTHQILLTSIPRDYYVQLHDTTGLKDKLTHAGRHGVDMTVQTIEDLLDTEINYYLKINFTSLVKIIDTLGGIDIDVPFDFNANYLEEDGTQIYYEFKEGPAHLDGAQALAYSRERYELREGDIGRARHQQQVIKAMLDKCLSKNILTKYASLLGAIEGNFETNLDLSSITAFIQNQLETMSPWQVDSQVLTGTGSSELTYTFPEDYGYVMIPDENIVKDAQEKIASVTNK